MMHIDGSQGEGGGQVLRSALTCSILSRQPIQITNIRANRAKPGLMAQHLKAVDAAAAISKAEVEGAYLHSKELVFNPGEIRSGRYHFDIGTAGAATLVLQTIFLPLSFASSASSITILGGTHVPWSPCFHFINLHWLPYLIQVGYDAQLTLEQAGFYPKGGGRIDATIRPVRMIQSLHLGERGDLLSIEGISAVANLHASIAERQKRQAVLRLQKAPWKSNAPNIQIKIHQLPSPTKGTLLLILAVFEGGRCCYYGLGELGKPAERVADEAVDALADFLATNGAIDQFLADQLLLPLCLAQEESLFRTSKITQHLLTNANIIQEFQIASIEVDGELNQPGLVRIKPANITKI